MNVSAFIRSYRKDFPWLRYCLLSLMKRGQEFSEIVVAVPEEDLEALLNTCLTGELDPYEVQANRIKVVSITPYTVNGYIDQQITKCHADEYCKGDFVVHFDSDCIATREVNISALFDTGGTPKLLFRKWEDAGTAADAWRLVTKSVLGQDPPFETMASHPFIFHRSTHELFRRHIASIHGGDFVKYVSRLSAFSEFNAIGNFALLFTPDAYRFVRASGEGDGYPRPFRQHWSHDRINHAEMQALLQ